MSKKKLNPLGMMLMLVVFLASSMILEATDSTAGYYTTRNSMRPTRLRILIELESSRISRSNFTRTFRLVNMDGIDVDYPMQFSKYAPNKYEA